MGRGADDVVREGGQAAIDQVLQDSAAWHAVAPVRSGPQPLPTVRLADVMPESVCWLWPGRIPLGKLSVLDGDPGLGKSTLTLAIIAAVTGGPPLPGEQTGAPPRAAILASVEDGLADTIRPRLDAAGADLTRVHAVPLAQGLRIPDDVERLAATARRDGAAVLVIDPLMAVLSASHNSHRDQDVRGALAPLAVMAEDTGCAVLIVRHLNKGGQGSSALYRGGGSIAIAGAARSVLLLGQDPAEEGVRILARTKCNLAPPVPSLRLRLVQAGEVARIEWAGESELGADDLLQERRQETTEERSALKEAEGVLHSILAHGPVPSKEVEEQAKEVGVSARTLRRARKAIGVRVRREGGTERGSGHWIWTLPDVIQEEEKQ